MNWTALAFSFAIMLVTGLAVALLVALAVYCPWGLVGLLVGVLWGIVYLNLKDEL